MSCQTRTLYFVRGLIGRLNGDVLLAGALALTVWIVILAAAHVALRVS